MFKTIICLLACLPHVCLCACIVCSHAHVASLANMIRLQCILHACLVPWFGDGDWALGLFSLHFIWHENCTLDPLGHHAWKCVIGGPRIEAHPPLSHKHDKECVGCIHCLNWAAMQDFALCCCKLQVLQELIAGRQCLVPTGSQSMAGGSILCRRPHPNAGGHFL